MNKLVVCFMLLFFVGSLLSSVMDGGGGIVATRLTTGITSATTTLTVSNTEGFLKSDYVTLGNERIKYTDKTDTTFTGCTRGYDDTVAVAHSSGEKVYSSDATVINAALGFNSAATGASVGSVSIPIMFVQFVTVSLPRLITWDYSWLKVNVGMQYVRIFLSLFSVGFAVYMSYMIASLLGGILQGIFLR